MVASADDYAWFTEQCAELADAYCLTLVRGRTPDEVIKLLGGAGVTLTIGLRRLPGLDGDEPRSGDRVAAGIGVGDGAVPGIGVGDGVVAATAFGDWTLIAEPRMTRGAADPGLRELSRGTELVSHCDSELSDSELSDSELSDSELSDPRFVWMRDGVVLLDFDPTSPGTRRGSDAGDLAPVLDRLGFDLTAKDSDAEWAEDARYRERALALGEQLTGVRLTLEALEDAAWRWATRPDPADAVSPATGPAAIPTPRPAPQRRWSRAEKWDEEYEIDDEDGDREDGEDDGDPEEREWPRLMLASARRIGRLFR